MRFVPFELERWQSTWENRVRFNLSESGVHPLTVQELLGLAGASAVPLLETRLGYSQSNGTDLLRDRIASLYPGATRDQVLVTNGSAEANFVACWRLIENGRAGLAVGGSSLVGLKDSTVEGNRMAQLLNAEVAQTEVLSSHLGPPILDPHAGSLLIKGGHVLINGEEVAR